MEAPEHSPGSSVAIPDGTYVVDTERSELRFRAKAFAALWVRGRMPALDGTIQVRAGRLSASGAIAAQRVDTGLPTRDWHLRSSHYLHSARHPRIAITVDGSATDAPESTAEIEVRGVAAPLRLRIADLGWQDGRLRLEAEGDLDRSSLPMLPPIAGVSRIVHCRLMVEAQLS
ncbi:MAG: YceI family protein [Pseudonocardia sp.]|nr:YceI family protein [Pseudonocardia sp.]